MEHIILESKEVDEPPLKPESIKNVHANVLLKHPVLHQVIAITLFNQRYLQLNYLSPQKGGKKVIFNLSYVDPCPIDKKMMPWKWILITSLIFGFAALLYAFDFHVEYLPASICTGIACLLMSRYRFKHTLQYLSLIGQVVLFELPISRKNKSTLKKLIKLITQKTLSANHQSQKNKEAHLSAELKFHRYLYEQGTLQEQDYEKAKAQILSDR